MMQACPIGDISQCQCRGRDLIHSALCTYYPVSGFFRYDRRLFDVREHEPGYHVWQVALQTSSRVPTINALTSLRKHFLSLHVGHWSTHPNPVSYPLLLYFMVDGCSLMTHVWRIQRAVRSFIWHRRVKRRTAVMMAVHERLGYQSTLACLSSDLLHTILTV